MPKDILFKNNDAAFEYVEQFLPGQFIKGEILIDLVVAKHKLHSSPEIARGTAECWASAGCAPGGLAL